MSKLYNMRLKIEEIISANNLDTHLTKGKINLQTGFILSFIMQDTPDDPIKIEKLEKAVQEVLKTAI